MLTTIRILRSTARAAAAVAATSGEKFDMASGGGEDELHTEDTYRQKTHEVPTEQVPERERYDCIDCISNRASGISSTAMDIEASISSCREEIRCKTGKNARTPARLRPKHAISQTELRHQATGIRHHATGIRQEASGIRPTRSLIQASI